MLFDRKGDQTYKKKLIFYICFSFQKEDCSLSNVDLQSITSFSYASHRRFIKKQLMKIDFI